jgi:MMPL family
MSVFGAIARFDVRFRWVILVTWIAAAPIAARTLPGLASVTQTSNAQFLPAGAPSAAADMLAAPFEGNSPASSAILVAYQPEAPLTTADQHAVAGLEHSIAAVPGVTAVHDEGLSPNGRAAEALVATTASVTSDSNAAKTIVTSIRDTFTTAAAPPGLKLYLTGQLAGNVDSANSARSGTVEQFALLFIVVLLIVVFRSLLAPLVTLLPAALSLVIAGPLIAEAAKGGLFQVSMLTQLLLIVLLLGAGTDYGLFLVFRTREEAGNGHHPKQAVVRALAPVGQTITFSALTVAAALAALLLAPFGIYHGIGPSLALGLGVLLLASLTLTPALLAIFGTATFWPCPSPRPPGCGAVRAPGSSPAPPSPPAAPPLQRRHVRRRQPEYLRDALPGKSRPPHRGDREVPHHRVGLGELGQHRRPDHHPAPAAVPLQMQVGGLDRLGVDDRGGGVRAAAGQDAYLLAQCVVHPPGGAVGLPGADVTIGGSPVRQVGGQRPPHAPVVDQVADAVDDVAAAVAAGAAALSCGRAGCGQQRLDDRPFGVGHVRGIPACPGAA